MSSPEKQILAAAYDLIAGELRSLGHEAESVAPSFVRTILARAERFERLSDEMSRQSKLGDQR